MRKRTYVGVIERATEGFGIYFPDFPGCVSGGDTLEETMAMGGEVLQFHIESMVADGDPIPDARDVDLDRERVEVPEARLHSLAVITVDVPSFPGMIDIALPSDVVRELAVEAQRAGGVNARTLIENAARRELERLKTSA